MREAPKTVRTAFILVALTRDMSLVARGRSASRRLTGRGTAESDAACLADARSGAGKYIRDRHRQLLKTGADHRRAKRSVVGPDELGMQ
jgi:hypothetical protein